MDSAGYGGMEIDRRIERRQKEGLDLLGTTTMTMVTSMARGIVDCGDSIGGRTSLWWLAVTVAVSLNRPLVLKMSRLANGAPHTQAC